MNKIYSSALAFLLLLAIGTAKAQHFTPDVSAFDNYMTITGYVVIDGEEIGNANYEIGCFIDGQCRGSYQVAAADYLGHAYACFLSVWGSSSDNGKTITIKIYDQADDKEYEADENPTYQYNGELGTETPYQLTVFTDPSQVQYYVATGSSENGSVSADKTSAKSGTQITLTIAPNAGYELATIAASKTNETGTEVTLSGSGSTRTFTMPAYGVTVTATFQKTADQQAVETAAALIAASTFTAPQESAGDETALKTWLAAQINALPGMSGTGITVSASDITLNGFTAATAGNAGNPSGTNGSFTFSVSLTRGASMLTAIVPTGVIVATPYTVIPVKRIELSLTGNLTARILNTGNTATGDLTLALSGENADAFTLSKTMVSSLAEGDDVYVTLACREGLAAGTYTATLTVSGEGLTPETVTIIHTVTSTGINEVQAKALKAYIRNGLLHVSGLTAGKPWTVYGISGAFVYQGIANSDEADVSLLIRSVYIVKSGNKTVKVVY
jgi:hypothetical protein